MNVRGPALSRPRPSADAPPAISVRGLRTSFGDLVVLDGIDFDVAEGTVFALLGPNGAGKTTTVRVLATLLEPDAGEVTVAGYDLARDRNAVRGAIGVTGQFSAVDNLLTGEENLQLMADLRHLERAEGRRRVAELLERFELTDAAKRPVSTYSGGMKRRLGSCDDARGRPRIVFLDEPTAGLDPRSRRTMWEMVEALVAEGVTIFLTTQHLEEADRLADRIAVLDGGRLVAEGTAAELKRLVPGGHITIEFASRRGALGGRTPPRRRAPRPRLASAHRPWRLRPRLAPGRARPARLVGDRRREPLDPLAGPRRRVPRTHR